MTLGKVTFPGFSEAFENVVGYANYSLEYLPELSVEFEEDFSFSGWSEIKGARKCLEMQRFALFRSEKHEWRLVSIEKISFDRFG